MFSIHSLVPKFLGCVEILEDFSPCFLMSVYFGTQLKTNAFSAYENPFIGAEGCLMCRGVKCSDKFLRILASKWYLDSIAF